MSSRHTQNQEAWRNFAVRFLLILDAMLADLLIHMHAEAASLPAEHPEHRALRAALAELTRLRDAFAAATIAPAPTPVLRTAPRPSAAANPPSPRPVPITRPAATRWRRCTTKPADSPPDGRGFCAPILLR